MSKSQGATTLSITTLSITPVTFKQVYYLRELTIRVESRLSVSGRLQPCWNCQTNLKVTNTLAYFGTELITAVKCFIA